MSNVNLALAYGYLLGAVEGEMPRIRESDVRRRLAQAARRSELMAFPGLVLPVLPAEDLRPVEPTTPLPADHGRPSPCTECADGYCLPGDIVCAVCWAQARGEAQVPA